MRIGRLVVLETLLASIRIGVFVWSNEADECRERFTSCFEEVRGRFWAIDIATAARSEPHGKSENGAGKR